MLDCQCRAASRVPGLFLLILTVGACAPSTLIVKAPACPPVDELHGIRWLVPASASEAEHNRRWCEAVGPMVLRTVAASRAPSDRRALFIVSWNVAIGSGRVDQLVGQLVEDERGRGRPEPDFVLLLQETFHSETAAGAPRQQEDVLAISKALDLNAVYIPSMRNRSAGEADRGNAILTTLPLHDVTALELPFVRQRHVAVAAGVDVSGSTLTVLSVHLSTRAPFLQGSVFAGPLERKRQSRALVDALSTIRARRPIVVGGDFNTVAGLQEPAIRLMEERFTRVDCGSPITHSWGWALDHLFASDPSLFQNCSRMKSRYGSDHHPLVARFDRAAARVSGQWPEGGGQPGH